MARTRLTCARYARACPPARFSRLRETVRFYVINGHRDRNWQTPVNFEESRNSSKRGKREKSSRRHIRGHFR
jgi:hypothetical protein